MCLSVCDVHYACIYIIYIFHNSNITFCFVYSTCSCVLTKSATRPHTLLQCVVGMQYTCTIGYCHTLVNMSEISLIEQTLHGKSVCELKVHMLVEYIHVCIFS